MSDDLKSGAYWRDFIGQSSFQGMLDQIKRNVAESGKLLEKQKYDIASMDLKIGNLQGELRDRIDRMRSETDQKTAFIRRDLDNFLADAKKKTQDAVADLDRMKLSTLGSEFFKIYEKKADAELNVVESCEKWFGGMIIALIIISLLSVIVNVCVVWGNASWLVDFVKNMPRMALMGLPFYAPIVWFACYKNFQTRTARRLLESYRHKQYIGATFIGLTSQIGKIGEANAVAANDLMANLLRSIIDVYRVNPIETCKDVKAYTPMAELTSLLDSATGFANSLRDREKISNQR